MQESGLRVDIDDFVRVSRALREMDKGAGRKTTSKGSILGQMRKDFVDIADPIKNKMASEVQRLGSKSTGATGGSVGRASAAMSRRKEESATAFQKRLARAPKRRKGESDEAYAGRVAARKAALLESGPRGAETEEAYHRRVHKAASLSKFGLRATTARSLTITVKDNGYAQQIGVRITTDGRKFPENARRLPRNLDSDKGWRHPVFGRKGEDRSSWTWARQYGTPAGWFMGTAAAAAPFARRRIEETLEKWSATLADLLNRAA